MIPRLQGRYRLAERLGGGGYAQTYLCAPSSSGRRQTGEGRLAIKVFQRSSYANTFEREVRILRLLDGCPNQPRFVDAGRDPEGRLCIVTRFIPGIRLDKLINSGKRLSVDQAESLLTQMLPVLSWAHERGVIHKDVKASNILMDGQCFTLLDWGCAELRGDGRSESIRAKREFVAPECYYGHHDFATDFYSLAWLLVHALTGRLPYSFADIRDPDYRVAAHCLERPQLNAAIHPILRNLLWSWLAKEPEARLLSYDLDFLLTRSADCEPDFARFLILPQMERRGGFLLLAARHGIPFAQYHLALRQLKEKREASARYWLEAAAEQDYAMACYRLARLIVRWEGDESEPARRLLQRAAQAGDCKAQHRLGMNCLRAEGDGIAMALAWLRRAADGGYAPAQWELAGLLEREYGDGDEAERYRRQAADRGYPAKG